MQDKSGTPLQEEATYAKTPKPSGGSPRREARAQRGGAALSWKRKHVVSGGAVGGGQNDSPAILERRPQGGELSAGAANARGPAGEPELLPNLHPPVRGFASSQALRDA